MLPGGTSGGCAALANCENSIGSFDCSTCPHGYEMGVSQCVDDDECADGNHACASLPGPPGGACIDPTGKFTREQIHDSLYCFHFF